MKCSKFLLFMALYLFTFANSFNPLRPTNSYSYVIEAARSGTWPACMYRFLNRDVNLISTTGANQQWNLTSSGLIDGTFYISNNGSYLSASSNCSLSNLTLTTNMTINERFTLIPSSNKIYEYYIQAAGRTCCPNQYLNFPVICTTNSVDTLNLTNTKGANQIFRLHPINTTNPIIYNGASSCADPFAWNTRNNSGYWMHCTGMPIFSSPIIQPNVTTFASKGYSIGGSPPVWASNGNRWAPENYETLDGRNYIFFSAQQTDGRHRIGWALSKTGPGSGAYNVYSPNYLNLGNDPAGEIDVNIFEDDNGKTYILWKTDDNGIGLLTTRIFIQEISFANNNVTLIGNSTKILDSTGLWWVTSWIWGGSLIEGPELIKKNGIYYLFFASGRYCQTDYYEGVAKSTTLLGPYEKMLAPLLSTGMVGVSLNPADNLNEKLIGPGHASFLKANNNDNDWKIVFHANWAGGCSRHAFIANLTFGQDGWPFVEF